MESTYYDTLFNSKNQLRRISQKARFAKSVKLLDLKDGDRILDFGCGDGHFLNMLKNSTDKEIKIYGFEPFMESKDTKDVKIYKNWNEIIDITTKDGLFDYVTCFEVLEHFNAAKQLDTLKMFQGILVKEGCLVISVPIEIGLPAIVKNLVRKFQYSWDKEMYTFKNFMDSLLGRPMPNYRNGDDYLSHMGFFFQDLEKLITKYFIVTKKIFSPFNILGRNFNSQVLYKLRKKVN